MHRLLAAALLAIVASQAHALDRIINVSGQSALCNGCPFAPETYPFDAGSYLVTPLLANTAPGALFTAYDFGHGLGFSAAYAIAVDPAHISDFGTSGPHAGAGWPDPATAFAHSAIGSFSLASAGTVYFGVPDSIYGDNSGGVSLKVSPIPVPGSVALLMSGVAWLGLAFQRRHARGTSAI